MTKKRKVNKQKDIEEVANIIETNPDDFMNSDQPFSLADQNEED